MTLTEDSASSIEMSVRTELTAGLGALGIDAQCAPPLLAYLAILLRWNCTYNLTAIKEPQAMVQRHLLDSLAIHPYLTADRLADLGSGAGFPGIPLAIANPALQVDLIESNGKKVRFLREVIHRLGLTNVEVIQRRIEATVPPHRYPCLVARALCALAPLVSLCSGLLRPSGQLLAMKGIYPTQEIAALPPSWSVAAVHPIAVPGLNEQRHLVVLTPPRS